MNTFDFSALDIPKGKIAFSMIYYDDKNIKPCEGNVYLYGIDRRSENDFEIKGEYVVFSIR